jgi:uncharacterized protein YprB with RNaseH-like and TPR domain
MFKPEEYVCEHRHNGLEHRACFLRYIDEHEPERIGFLDIETCQLTADYGFMISWSIKERGGKVLADFLNKKDFEVPSFDRRLVSTLIKEMNKYDVIYTYYGSRFDIPFIRTRAMKYNLNFPVQNQIIHRDLYYIVRNKLKLSSNRLANATRFLGIKGKTNLDGDIWVRAARGDQHAIAYILDHNAKDVIILEELFERIKPYMTRTRTSI